MELCVPTQLSEIAPARHLLEISSQLPVGAYVGGFHQEGGGFLWYIPLQSSPLTLSIPNWLLFTRLALGLNLSGNLLTSRHPLLGLVHIHGGGGQPLPVVDPQALACLTARNAQMWVSHCFGYYRHFGFQKPQWERTLGLYSRTSGAHSPKVVGLLVLQPLGSLSPTPGGVGNSLGQREDVRHICGQERLSRSDQCDLGFKSQQFLLLCQEGQVLGSEVLYGEGEESESQHMEGLLTLLQRQGYAGKPLGQREKRRREKR